MKGVTMEKRNGMQDYFPFVPIPCGFIENHMVNSNPSFVIIYMYILKNSMFGENMELNNLAESTNMLASDIKKCLSYWQDKNLIKFQIDNLEIVSIQFLDPQKCSEPKITNIAPSLETSTSVTRDNQEVLDIFRFAEKKLGKMLSYSERNILVKLYENYGISTELLALLFTYCMERGKSNFSYMEKVAIDWLENEVDTIEKVEAYLDVTDTGYKRVKVALGIKNRDLIKKELEFINCWIFKYKIPINLIEEACIRTIMGGKGASFSYIEGIMKKWFEQGIITHEKLKEYDEKHEQSVKSKFENKKDQTKFKNSRNNKFTDYNQKPVDTQILKKLEQQSLKGIDNNEY